MNSNAPASPIDDPILRETLKRCSPATYYAACKYRAGGAVEHLHEVVLGVVERFVDRERRAVLQRPPEACHALRLREDLGLDSLTMMEIIMITEEVLQFSISNEELTRLRTLGDVNGFITTRVAAPSVITSSHGMSPVEAWDVAQVGEQVRAIEAGSSTLTSLPNHRPRHA